MYLNTPKLLSIMASRIPNHIAIILDGNRRYARKIGLKPWLGHEFGVKKLEQLLDWCREIGIKQLTLYAFSTENFNRSKKEKYFLFNIFKREFKNMVKRKSIFKNRVRINVIGRLNMFPVAIRKAMFDIMGKTKNHKNFTVNFAMAYGGRQEITDAVKKIAENVKRGKINPKNINESSITQNLYLKEEPELVIRPGGEIRTSNFLTWQSIYSEWIFVPKLWPEFTKEDLMKCIEILNKRQRRFGE